MSRTTGVPMAISVDPTELLRQREFGRIAEGQLASPGSPGGDVGRAVLLRMANQGRLAEDQLLAADDSSQPPGVLGVMGDIRRERREEDDRRIVQGLSDGSLVIPSPLARRQLTDYATSLAAVAASKTLDAEQKADAIAKIRARQTEIRRSAEPPAPESIPGSPQDLIQRHLAAMSPEDRTLYQGKLTVNGDGQVEVMRGANVDRVEGDLVAMADGKGGATSKRSPAEVRGPVAGQYQRIKVGSPDWNAHGPYDWYINATSGEYERRADPKVARGSPEIVKVDSQGRTWVYRWNGRPGVARYELHQIIDRLTPQQASEEYDRRQKVRSDAEQSRFERNQKAIQSGREQLHQWMMQAQEARSKAVSDRQKVTDEAKRAAADAQSERDWKKGKLDYEFKRSALVRQEADRLMTLAFNGLLEDVVDPETGEKRRPNHTEISAMAEKAVAERFPKDLFGKSWKDYYQQGENAEPTPETSGVRLFNPDAFKTPGGAKTASPVAMPKSREEFDALAPGVRYRLPDGREGVK